MNELTRGDLNFVWAYAFADTLASKGVTDAVISPGSRSTPLTLAFAHHDRFTCHSIVDERSAGFFALGIGKATKKPAVLICTSGTAGTNYFPAITEAFQSHTPLIIATADRPPHLQNSGSNQTINQRELYGDKVKHYHGFKLPEKQHIRNLRCAAAESYRISIGPSPGPVHCNFPFDKPLEPAPVSSIKALLELYEKQFREHIDISEHDTRLQQSDPEYLLETIRTARSGVIMAGPANYDHDLIQVILLLNEITGYPVLADGLSQLRHLDTDSGGFLHFSSDYFRTESIRRSVEPECIIRFGGLPTSNCLNQFLDNHRKTPHILIDNKPVITDIHHSVSRFVQVDYPQLCQELKGISSTDTLQKSNLSKLHIIEERSTEILRESLGSVEVISEPSLYTSLHQLLPAKTNIFLSNSFPVRDYDNFALPSHKDHPLYFNRGASGIDGIVSTALGISTASERPTLLVTGDLAMYHDMNSLTYVRHCQKPFVILLIDNNGGGIFEMLPVSGYGEVYERYVRTPLSLNFEEIIRGFGISYSNPRTMDEYRNSLRKSFESDHAHVIHVRTDAGASMQIRESIWKKIQEAAEESI
ncbi:MAG: 2-succinyl-5-enolpyruvyl-6-hydroxy-3-cyclohexene-1-carboxylic-acid synthase [Candidatus Marinimicrobia bacterium]|nr:2-succinyl-5-enolpyruvyl-6-hydroxy-3-cyclohexene-1-carboxylic-acid synthase [Candidatus Neomarinimicrobiota bacterium]